MYVIHSHLKLDSADGEAFERTLVESRSEERIAAAPGFVRRLLLRDESHPGEYFYLSLWETEEQHHRYQEARIAQLEAAESERQERGEPASPQPEMVRCETTLVFEDVAAG